MLKNTKIKRKTKLIAFFRAISAFFSGQIDFMFLKFYALNF